MINMEFKADAVQVITNDAGIEIMIHPDGDNLSYRFFIGDKHEEVQEAEIKHSDGDDYSEFPYTYFELAEGNLDGEKIRYALDDFMRVDMGQTMRMNARNVGIKRDRQGRR
jgi:hypothetical protein